MIKNTKNLSFTFSPKALLSCRPGSSLLRDIRVLFSLGFFSSKTYCLCLPVVLSKKEKNYINFRVLLTKVKLFYSFLCKTTYSELLKELIYYIKILLTFQEKTFNYFNRIEECLHCVQTSLIHPLPQGIGVFSDKSIKIKDFSTKTFNKKE